MGFGAVGRNNEESSRRGRLPSQQHWAVGSMCAGVIVVGWVLVCWWCCLLGREAVVGQASREWRCRSRAGHGRRACLLGELDDVSSDLLMCSGIGGREGGSSVQAGKKRNASDC